MAKSFQRAALVSAADVLFGCTVELNARQGCKKVKISIEIRKINLDNGQLFWYAT